MLDRDIKLNSSCNFAALDFGDRIVHSSRFLAIEPKSKQLVVIQKIEFNLDQIPPLTEVELQGELRRLQGFEHPSIPRYLDAYLTKTGLCLVQQYYPALPLTRLENVTVEEVKHITAAALKVLFYLHGEAHSYHGNLDGKSILWNRRDRQLYLTDFNLLLFHHKPSINPKKCQDQSSRIAADLQNLGVVLTKLLKDKSDSTTPFKKLVN